MSASARPERVEILSAQDLTRTVQRLSSQVLESVDRSEDLLLLGIPTRGVHLARVLARQLEVLTGHPLAQGTLDPTFHRDDLQRVGTRMVQATDLPISVEGRDVLLVDDVITTGATLEACIRVLQAEEVKPKVLKVAAIGVTRHD